YRGFESHPLRFDGPRAPIGQHARPVGALVWDRAETGCREGSSREQERAGQERGWLALPRLIVWRFPPTLRDTLTPAYRSLPVPFPRTPFLFALLALAPPAAAQHDSPAR